MPATAAVHCDPPWHEAVDAVDSFQRTETVARLFISFGGVASVRDDDEAFDFLPSREAEQKVLDLLDAPPQSR